jgi:hypothetical protein
MVEQSLHEQVTGTCEPDPESFSARSVYTDEDRMVVVTGRCRSPRQGVALFLDPEDPMGGQPEGTLRLRWTTDASAAGASSAPHESTVHEIYDVPENVTAVVIEGVGLVPIEEPPD